IAQIHGGMHFTERQEQIERFRRSHHDGGARFMVCTDAAAEGVNLQFCWLMINYDVPWNPARLEQRMGRIHRYGQKHDPVIILNLVAPATREGRVLKTLLDKLETIRKELKSDKVFDSIGRMFQDVSIKQYMEMAVVGNADDVARDLGGRLTKEQLEALAEREKSLFGAGGDVKTELPRLREDLEQETYFRLLPGYVRQFIQNAAPLVGIEIDGDLGTSFTLRAARRGALDPIFPAIEGYGESRPPAFSIARPADLRDAIWLHPGEPVFEALRETVSDRLADAARRGAVFVDPTDEKPYLFHLALIEVVRQADPEIGALAHEETLACRLVGVKQYEGALINLCPVEHLLLLKGGHGLPPVGQRLAARASDRVDHARSYLGERVARSMAMERQALLTESLPERERFVNRGFDFREAELAAARAKLTDKARNGNRAAQQHLAEVKQQQRDLAKRRAHALRVMRREPELISPSSITFVAHALVVPSSDPKDHDQHDANVERVAMDLAWAYEESSGAIVKDVHTTALARAAGLRDNPGFDLLSIYPSGEKRSIEVKGRAGVGEVEVSRNEWGRACNLGDEYWLYVVYNCATDSPDLRRIQDPFVNLLTKAKGSVLISPQHVLAASTGTEGTL
ncbi:MAG: helicase-related protein, partial [Planctomycetota bacterium]